MVPASTRDVTIPRFKRSKSSGVAPINPATLNTHVDGYAAERFRSADRSSITCAEVADRSRARTTFSISPLCIFATACATRVIQCSLAKSSSFHVRVELETFSGVSMSWG